MPMLKHAQEAETYLQILSRMENEQNSEKECGKDVYCSILRLLQSCTTGPKATS
jgi:hypothetical protein